MTLKHCATLYSMAYTRSILIICAIVCFECRAEDTVTQHPGNMNAVEGQSVTLDCKYSTSSSVPYLFWYIQYPNDFPRYVLRRDTFGARENTDEFKGKFDAFLNKTLKTVPLIIQQTELCDSAEYSVQSVKEEKPRLQKNNMEQTLRALVHIITLFCCLIENTQGQSVNQNASSVTVKEEENATLPCYYKDAAATDVYLFWYIQTGSRTPHPIYSDLLGDSNFPSKLQNRLSASHDKTGKTFHLIISSVDLSDSSVYFCALQPTARESAASAIQ
ncbi:hypothetical protein AOXY_G25698 [Acipenser oxyrinchus oxyrinchus]|uniref:Ig-like domain-containing protein n=1 Tax=Acipenser oxyrinchus oxyrinchus TaxID=40147 RepID=A0AAD8FXC2_ACIOX|nr:hypothetical protein AOXY_G25698 [Acipenser oxyrinchus oxyrinchus]